MCLGATGFVQGSVIISVYNLGVFLGLVNIPTADQKQIKDRHTITALDLKFKWLYWHDHNDVHC